MLGKKGYREMYKCVEGSLIMMDDNTISVSSLPDEFIRWVDETRSGGLEQKAPFLRRHLLQIPDYVEWKRRREDD